MTSSLVSIAKTRPHELPFDAWWFGIAAITTFLILLAILWSFRNVAAKYGQTQSEKHR